MQLFQVLFCHKKYKYHFLINCKPLDFQDFKAIFNFQIFAVICTFSFGSAFAAQTWTAEKTSEYLLDDYDFYNYANSTTATSKGTYGITEAYRTQLVKTYGYLLAGYTVNGYEGLAVLSGNYYTPEKDVAKTKIEEALAAVKEAKTDKAAYLIDVDLKADLTALTKGKVAEKYEATTGTNWLSEIVALGEATMTDNDFTFLTSGVEFVDFDTDDSADYGFFLDGYGFAKLTTASVQGVGNYHFDLSDSAVLEWLYDNGYNTKTEAKTGIAKLVAGLEANPVDKKFVQNFNAGLKGLATEIKAMIPEEDSDVLFAAAGATQDIKDVDTLLGKAIDFRDAYKYNYGLSNEANTPAFLAELWNSFETTYAAQGGKFWNVVVAAAKAYVGKDYATVKALPEYKKMTDADKENVIALYDYIWDCSGVYLNAESYLHLDTYDNHGGLTETVMSLVCYQNLEDAYEKFISDDEKAYKDLDSFTVYKMSGAKAYFDTAEKNVNALKAKRAAYDAFVGNYGYQCSTLSTVFTEAEEAKILAAEFNNGQDTAYDEKADKIDTSKVKAYLNNATVTVKSTKLAAKKVRVQAKLDTTSMKYMLDEMEDGFTVEYKFYHKAPGKSFKLTKTKGANYITYTSKSLKAGKNSFRVGVVIKDVKGNVVAEKSYMASTLAYRTIK